MNHPGQQIGIRAPEPGETPLSWAEVVVAVDLGLVADPLGTVDRFPPKRIIRKPGTWACKVERRGMWSGLMT